MAAVTKKFSWVLLALVTTLALAGVALVAVRESPQSSTPLEAPKQEAAPVVPQPVMSQREAVPSVPVQKISAALVSASALVDCLNAGGKSNACLDGIFRGFLKTRTTADALALVEAYGESDPAIRLSCHPIVHAIGRETFRLKGTVHDSFAVCNQTCHSGCYHGAMERFLRGDGADDESVGHISDEELNAKAASACDPGQPLRFRFQCLHGLGHALMFFSNYRLEKSLAGCDTQADGWGKSSCYGGVFMENVFSATPEKRDLSPTDYHYPCSKLDQRYRGDCYMMQTTRMSEMGLGVEQLFAECRKAGAYQHICMQSIGRDLSNDARIKDPRITSEHCEIGQGEERQACTRGVSYALIDNTWDGRYAFPFCRSFAAAEDAQFCFQISIGYLQTTFEKSGADITRNCRTYVPDSPYCALKAP